MITFSESVLDSEAARSYCILDILDNYRIGMELGDSTCDEINGQLWVQVTQNIINNEILSRILNHKIIKYEQLVHFTEKQWPNDPTAKT